MRDGEEDGKMVGELVRDFNLLLTRWANFCPEIIKGTKELDENIARAERRGGSTEPLADLKENSRRLRDKAWEMDGFPMKGLV